VSDAHVDDGRALLGRATRFRFRLASPALVQVTLQLPGGSATATDLGLREAGDQVLDVPASALPGTAQLVLRADAGGGRTAVVPVAFNVARRAAPARPARLAAVDRLLPAPPFDGTLQVSALALVLLAFAFLIRAVRQVH
jgi:hypothetical protein